MSLVVRGRTPSQGTTTPNMNHYDGLISNNIFDVPNFPKQGRSGGGPKFEQSRNLMEFCVSLVVRGRTPSQGTTTPNINYHDGLISNNLCDYPNSDCLWHP